MFQSRQTQGSLPNQDYTNLLSSSSTPASVNNADLCPLSFYKQELFPSLLLTSFSNNRAAFTLLMLCVASGIELVLLFSRHCMIWMETAQKSKRLKSPADLCNIMETVTQRTKWELAVPILDWGRGGGGFPGLQEVKAARPDHSELHVRKILLCCKF